MILILDVGKLDESNIILGKRRRRRKIDYAFCWTIPCSGHYPLQIVPMIDDEVEFQYKVPARWETSSDSNDDAEESSDASQVASGI